MTTQKSLPVGWAGSNKKAVKLPAEIISIESEFDDKDIALAVAKHDEEKSGLPREAYGKLLSDAVDKGKDTVRFWNLLAENVGKSGFKPPLGRPLVILVLACKDCEEARILKSYFSGNKLGYGHETDAVFLMGVDENPELIKKAINKNSYFKAREKFLPPSYLFVAGDLCQIGKLKEIPDELDVVVLRNPEFEDDKKWASVLAQAVKKIRPEGIILITCFSEEEKNSILVAMADIGLQVLSEKLNEFAKKESSAGKNSRAVYDKWVIVAKRK